MTSKEFSDWRKRMGWTQVEAANQLGFTSGAVMISRMENGDSISPRTELACIHLERVKNET